MKKHSRYPHTGGTVSISADELGQTMPLSMGAAIVAGDNVESDESSTEATTYAHDGKMESDLTVTAAVAGFVTGARRIRSEPIEVVIAVTWLVIISWLFIRDNELDRLGTWSGIGWLGLKIVLYSVVYIAAGYWILREIRRHEGPEKGKR